MLTPKFLFFCSKKDKSLTSSKKSKFIKHQMGSIQIHKSILSYTHKKKEKPRKYNLVQLKNNTY